MAVDCGNFLTGVEMPECACRSTSNIDSYQAGTPPPFYHAGMEYLGNRPFDEINVGRFGSLWS